MKNRAMWFHGIEIPDQENARNGCLISGEARPDGSRGFFMNDDQPPCPAWHRFQPFSRCRAEKTRDILLEMETSVDEERVYDAPNQSTLMMAGVEGWGSARRRPAWFARLITAWFTLLMGLLVGQVDVAYADTYA